MKTEGLEGVMGFDRVLKWSLEWNLSELICPEVESMVAGGIGEPPTPVRFKWRRKQYEVARIVGRWKETGACTHGSGERYVRKHWFELVTGDGLRMKLYFERRPRRGMSAKTRWWLYTVE